VTYVKEERLRTLCTVILRHLGYRVYEALSAHEAAATVRSQSAAVLVAGSDEHENEELRTTCSDARIKCITVAPDSPIEVVLSLLERRAKPRV
jgi:hypothetical protein